MNVYEIFNFILFIITKEQTGWFSPEEVMSALNSGQIDVYNEYKPTYGKDADSTAALAPFKAVYQVIPANSAGGVVTVPPTPRFTKLLSFLKIDYDNVRKQNIYPEVDILGDDELSARLNSQLLPVTVNRPVATTIGDGKFQLWPNQPNTAQVTYLRMPVAPVMNYAMAGRDIDYISSGSTQLEWSPNYHFKIIARSLYYLGINIDDTTLITIFNQQSKEAA